MSDLIKQGEIVYCNLKVRNDKNKIYEFKEVVYKQTNGFYYEKRFFDQLKIFEQLRVFDLEILARLGFESKNIGHTEAVKSNEQRNKITGAYE